MGTDRVDVALRATDRLRRAIDRRAFAQDRIVNNKEEAELLHKHQTGLEKKQKAFAGTVQQLDYKVHKLEGDQLASIRFAEAVEKGLWQAGDEKKFLQKELGELSKETRREAEEKAKAQALANVHEKSCQEQQRQYEGKCEELAAAVEAGAEIKFPGARAPYTLLDFHAGRGDCLAERRDRRAQAEERGAGSVACIDSGPQ